MIYTFQHPLTEEVLEVEQKMSDVHEYTDEEGVLWNRIFHVPNAIIGAKIDPWSQNQFMDKTSGKGQKVGDLYARSEEMSLMRAEQNNGVDPLKVKAEKLYADRRRGQKTPKKFKDINVTVDTKKIKK